LTKLGTLIYLLVEKKFKAIIGDTTSLFYTKFPAFLNFCIALLSS